MTERYTSMACCQRWLLLQAPGREPWPTARMVNHQPVGYQYHDEHLPFLVVLVVCCHLLGLTLTKQPAVQWSIDPGLELCPSPLHFFGGHSPLEPPFLLNTVQHLQAEKITQIHSPLAITWFTTIPATQ
jgi:hypothetical protein